VNSLTTLGEAAALPADITPHQLEDSYGDDEQAFSLLAVAEASLNRMPAAVTQWLSSPQRCAAWEEVLAVQEGNHQLSWWSKMTTLGIEDPDTLRADRRLARIRQRRTEAHLIVDALTGPPRSHTAQARALDRLKTAHDEETEWMVDKLRRSSGIAAGEAVTPRVRELLDLDDGQFRALVARDVQGRVDADGLGHPAVLPRWYGALIELGSATFEQIGLPVAEHHLKNWFAVPDRYLIQARHDAPVDAWAPKLTFLTHVRARLLERSRLRARHARRLAEQVQLPAERHLTQTYPEEYARLVREETTGAPPAADPRAEIPNPPHPQAFDEYAAVLARHDWDVTWIFDGRRVWLDAWKGPDWRKDGRIIVTAARTRFTGKSPWKWGKPLFVFNNRRNRGYTLLRGAEGLEEVAHINPKTTPSQHLKSVVPRTRDHLEQCVPPDGYRWRHPYPPELCGEVSRRDSTRTGTEGAWS
jgi:hypothetical protein